MTVSAPSISGGEKEDYDVLIGNTQIEVMAGDREAWYTLMDMARGDLSSAAAYEAIQEYLDIPAMIDYLLMIYYTGSRDAPVLLCNDNVPRNFYAIRRRDPAGPFIFVPWDVEWVLESPTVNRVRIRRRVESALPARSIDGQRGFLRAPGRSYLQAILS